MVLILLYTPCVAALGAIRHETSLGWTVFGAVWTTLLGYVASVSVYQVSRWGSQPLAASSWLAGCALVLVTAVFLMWLFGRNQARKLLARTPAE
jgi:ferrous iron transport protein B